MAALTQTAANVKPSDKATRISGLKAGASIAAGQPIYLDANNAWQLGGCATPGTAVPVAIAGNTAAVGQMVDAITEDPDFTHGLTGVVAGDNLWSHSTVGAITKTEADLVSTNYVTQLGVCVSATKCKIRILPAGVAK